MTYEQIDAEDFLEIVYGDREGWIDLPAKVGRYWVPFHTEWPADGAVSRRIDSSLRDREDLYYSVAQFAQRGRRIEDVLPAQWLWADLDEVHPTEGARLGLLPTVAVESSPGRFQGLWRLTRPCSPKVLEKLNRALSYALEADRGGWDLTQVLRIPGTRNFKYPDAPIVRLLWHKPELVYDPKAVWAALREVVPEEELRTAVSVVLPRKPIPARARALLRTSTVVEGERSARLWELECLLLESGLTEEETFELVWRSAWNKWAGIASGRRRLSTEIHKAAMRVARKAALKSSTTQEEREQSGEEEKDLRGGVVDSELDATPDRGADSGDSDETSPDRLPFVSYSSFMAMRMEAPRWLVEDIWT
ncbi:MAG TPA: DNA-primase RepB domain-containing protein, partial [Candidatus Paceibacterota bacterium]